MVNVKKIKNKWILALIIIFFIQLFTNILVLRKDNIYPLYNSMEPIGSAYKLAGDISNGKVSDLFKIHPLENPPLLGYLLMFNILLFGGSLDTMVHTNIIFLIILIYALYNLGKRLGDKLTGLLSVIICLSFPAVFGMSRILWNEYPLMCFVTLSFHLLFMTDNFKNKKYSFFWAFSVACALLIRFTLPIYIIAPVSFYVIKSFRIRKNYKRIIINILFCLFVILMLSGWWYLFSLKAVLADKLSLFKGGSVNILSNINRIWYNLCNISMYLPLFTLFIISLPLLLVRRTVEKTTILIAIIAPLILFMLSPNRTGFNSNRYFIPILPLFALSISSAFFLIDKRFLRIIPSILLLVLCYIQFILINLGFGEYFTLSQDKNRINKRDEDIIIEQGKVRPYVSEVSPEDLLDLINKNKKQYRPTLLFLGDFTNIESFFRIGILRRKIPIIVISSVQIIKGNPNLQNLLDDPKEVEKGEFILALSDNQDERDDAQYMYSTVNLPKMINYFKEKKDNYKKISEFSDKFGIKFALFQKIE
ncbi:MAG: glycosyltransferase family 39 protein [Candidatus Omnitrophica bacterium]|nr:glycosyltransferase family 39 protein [Candidatus Omnitrophota bacterium]